MRNNYYDDNFGFWDVPDNPEEKAEINEFYKKVKAESVWKECYYCGDKVKLRPEYDKCNSCMDKLESGQEW